MQCCTASHRCNATLSHIGAMLHCLTWVQCYTASHGCNATLSHMGAMLLCLTWVQSCTAQVIQTRKMAYRPGDYPGQIYNPDTHRLCLVGAGSTVQQANSCMSMCLIVPCFKLRPCSAAQTGCQQCLLIACCIPSLSNMPCQYVLHRIGALELVAKACVSLSLPGYMP